MKRNLKMSLQLLLLVTLLFSVVATRAQDARAAEKQVTEFDVKGMKVVVKRRPGTPTVAAGLFFRGGSMNLTPENAGIELFTLRAALEGSRKFPRSVLRKELSRIGTSFGAEANHDYSVLSLKSTAQNFGVSWQMFVDVVLNPTFNTADVELVRQAQIASLRSASNSIEAQLDELSAKVVYAGHPYANSPEGTIQNVMRFKASDLVGYHKSLLQTSRMLLVIVGDFGDINAEILRNQITKSFINLPRGNYKYTPPPPITFVKPTVDVEAKNTETNYVKGTFAAPSLRDPDYYAIRAAISALATNVFQEVRVKRNLSYSPTADIESLAANTATITFSSGSPNEVVKIMLAEMKNLRERPLDTGTLKELSGFFLTTHYLKQETNAAQVAELAQYELIGGGWRKSLVFLDKIRNVTAAEVQAAANKYMRNVRFTVLGNPADINRQFFLEQSN